MLAVVHAVRTITPLRLIAAAFNAAPEFVMAIDSGQRVLYVNSSAAQRIGLTPADIIGAKCFRAFAGRAHPCPGCRSGEAFKTGQTTEREKRDILADGSDVWLLQHWFPVDDPDLMAERIVVEVSNEITSLKSAQEQAIHARESAAELRAQRDRIRRFLDLTASTVLSLDTSGRVTLINRHGCEVLGRDESELLGRDWFETVVPPHERESRRRYFRDLVAGRTTESEPMLGAIVRPDGTECVIEWRHVAIHDDDGTITGCLSSGVDLTERRELETATATIERMSFYDALTGLPNRSLFLDRVEHALVASARAHTRLAVAFLDLDDFKSVNDTHGHRAADSLLIEVADRLSHAVRASDTVARFGGDEFAILFEDVSSDRQSRHLAAKLLASLERTFTLGTIPLHMTASAGVTVARAGSPDVDTLMIHADTAMYRAKYEGRDRCCLFEQGMSSMAHAALGLKRELSRAIKEGQFVLYYQPQCALADGTLSGFEALVRWQHPERGLLLPESFMQVCEENGHIIKLGEWALREACAQARRWQNEYGAFGMAVNLSPRQFESAGLVDTINGLLEDGNLAPGTLELEITENVAMRDAHNMRATFDRMRDLDVRLAIDDFGTGFSSLDQLMRLHVDTIKIDRRFVTDLGIDPRAEAISAAVIALGRNLDMRVVAEGVENPQQLAILRELGCDEVQGYLVGFPATVADAETLLASGHAVF